MTMFKPSIQKQGRRVLFLGLFILLSVLVSISVSGLVEKNEGSLKSNGLGYDIIWEHTKNTADKQEFILTATSNVARTLDSSLILSEYSKPYSSIDINDIEVYYVQESTSYEYFTKYCTDYSYTDCIDHNDTEHTINGGNGQREVIDSQDILMPISESQIKNNNEYFEFNLNDIVFNNAGQTKKLKIIFNKHHENGDHGVFSLNVDGVEFWDKTHSSDFLVTDAEVYINFDDSSLITTTEYADQSLSENNLILSTDSISGGDGIINEGVDFNGVSYAYFDEIFTDLSEFSISTWINMSETSGFYDILNNYGSGLNDAWLELRVFDSYFSVFADDGTNTVSETGSINVADGDFHHLVFIYNDATNDFITYVDGVKDIDSTTTYSLDISERRFYMGVRPVNNDRVFDGVIDEFILFNYAINDTEVTQLYNSGNGLVNPLNPLPVNITLDSQVPNDINFSNSFNGVNITYLAENINESSTPLIFLNYSITGVACPIIENGVCQTFPITIEDYTSLGSDLYRFELDEYNILPANYNLDEEYIRSTNGSDIVLDSQNDWISVLFKGFDLNTGYNYLEIDVLGESSASVPVVYCNSSYVNGNPLIDDNCGVFADIDDISTYDHIHSVYQGHQVVFFNSSDGTLGGVTTTEDSRFLIRGLPSNDITVKYRVNDTDTANISINGGNTWSSVTGTIDAHIHQFYNNESIEYYACGYNSTSGVECSNTTIDAFDALPSFSTLPFVAIINPNDGDGYTIDNSVTIRWVGGDVDGDSVEYYLMIDGDTILNGVTNTSYTTALTGYSGSIPINVKVCENGSLIRCNEQEISITVSTSTIPSTTFNFSWEGNSSVSFLSCPDTPHSLSMFYLAVFICMFAIVIGEWKSQGAFHVFAGLFFIFLSLPLGFCGSVISYVFIFAGLGCVWRGFKIV